MGGSQTKAAGQQQTTTVAVDAEKVAALQQATKFNEVEVSRLYETFMKVSDNGANPLDRDAFKRGLGMLVDAGLRNLDDSPFADRLFEMLDVNNDTRIDLQEFVTGLSCLCKGTPEEKLALSFKAYDLDGNGSISKDELAAMFKSAWMAGFQALSASHVNEELSREDLLAFSEEMSQLFADNAFASLDANNDGQLSFDEFKHFALAEPKITATLNGFKQEISITLLG